MRRIVRDLSSAALCGAVVAVVGIFVTGIPLLILLLAIAVAGASGLIPGSSLLAG